MPKRKDSRTCKIELWILDHEDVRDCKGVCNYKVILLRPPVYLPALVLAKLKGPDDFFCLNLAVYFILCSNFLTEHMRCDKDERSGGGMV